MNENILKRKSIRSFDQTPLSEETLDKIVDYISTVIPPESDIDWNFDTLPYVDMVRIGVREPGVKAPHYLVLRAERKNFSLQNSGFVGELACLYMASLGIGTCFVGSFNINPSMDFEDSLPYVIAIAFGYPAEPFRASADEAERKPLKNIVIGDFDGPYHDILEAGRLAPSSMNRQPLSFVISDSKIHIFRKKVFLNNPPISYAQCIDAGAALANMYYEAVKSGKTAHCVRMQPVPRWGKKIYQISLLIGS